MKTFFQELKNRRVYRVAIAYVVAGSAIVQVAGTVLPIFHAPDWVQQVFVVLIAIGFPMALVLAWSFDVAPFTVLKILGAAFSAGWPSTGRNSNCRERKAYPL